MNTGLVDELHGEEVLVDEERAKTSSPELSEDTHNSCAGKPTEEVSVDADIRLPPSQAAADDADAVWPVREGVACWVGKRGRFGRRRCSFPLPGLRALSFC